MTPDGEETSSKHSRGRWAGLRRGRSSGVSSPLVRTLPYFLRQFQLRVGSSLGYLNLRASSSKISMSFSSSAGEDDVLARGKCVGTGFRSVNVREKQSRERQGRASGQSFHGHLPGVGAHTGRGSAAPALRVRGDNEVLQKGG